MTKSELAKKMAKDKDYPKIPKALEKKPGDNSSIASTVTGFIACYVAIKTEGSVRRLFIIFAVVIISALLLRVTPLEFFLLLISWSIVVTGEMFNTSLEKAMDYASGKEFHPLIRKGKDYAAGSVFIVSTVAIILTAYIFYFRFK